MFCSWQLDNSSTLLATSCPGASGVNWLMNVVMLLCTGISYACQIMHTDILVLFSAAIFNLS